MVHVKKCPNPDGRGKSTTEFYIDGKPQIYCYGWQDAMTDEPLPECKEGKDWVYGEQCEKDFEEAKANGFKSNQFHSEYKQGTKEYMHDYYEQVIKPKRQARKREINADRTNI